MKEKSDYRYLAAGTYIGYAGAIRKMNNELLSVVPTISKNQEIHSILCKINGKSFPESHHPFYILQYYAVKNMAKSFLTILKLELD